MYEWILPSLKEVLSENQFHSPGCSTAKAEQQWRVSLAATENLLRTTLATTAHHNTGLVLAAPTPLFSHPQLTQQLQTVTFTTRPFNPLALMPFMISSEMGENINNIETNTSHNATFQESRQVSGAYHFWFSRLI